MSPKEKIVFVICSLLVVTTSSGCLWAPELDSVRKDIERQLPGSSFNREFALSLGPVSMAIARAIVRFVPEAKEARQYLGDIRSVKIAVYEVQNAPADAQLHMPNKLHKLIKDDEWEIAVKVKEPGENVWLAYRTRETAIKEIYVVVLSDDELVLVRAEGDIDRLAVKAMRDHMPEHARIGIPHL